MVFDQMKSKKICLKQWVEVELSVIVNCLGHWKWK